jgi:tetratricopeptide (TPR) repeat protein
MMQFITPIDFDGALDEWADHFRRKSFTLARATMLDACEFYPRRPETWFLLGLTELAARDVKNAEDHMRQVAAMLDSGDFDRADFFRKYEPAMRQLTPWIIGGLERRTLYAAPYDPWTWLDNWQEVVKVRPSQASSLSFQPLGRSEPLMGSKSRAGEMPSIPRLMDQLRVEPLRVQSMQEMLGRDAKLAIDKSRIRIMDNSVVIDKPLLRAADGTYQPLKTVDVQRPRWDADYKPPPRTVSDLAPAVKLPPLPKLEPVTLAPVSALPPVQFERPDLPSMQALSEVALPGATPVELKPFVMERPPIPEAPELQALRKELKSPSPEIKIEAPAPPKPAALQRQPASAPAALKVEKVAHREVARVRPPTQQEEGTGKKRKQDPRDRSPEAPAALSGGAPSPAIAAPVIAATAAAAAGTDVWDKWEREVEALAASGAVTEALRRAAQAVEKYPQSARLEEFYGGLLERSGRMVDAARSYVEAYRKAKESGAMDRANRALDRATGLARRSGPLMLEIGALVAGLGATGVAAALLADAADHFRKSGERRHLVQVLDLLRRVAGTNPKALEDLQRRESEVGQVVGEARSLAPQVREVAAGFRGGTPTTHPPQQQSARRSPVAPRVSSVASQNASQAQKARSVDTYKSPESRKGKQSRKESGDNLPLLPISIAVLIFTLASGWSVPALIGGVLAYLQLMKPSGSRGLTAAKLQYGLALAVFALSFLVSLFR